MRTKFNRSMRCLILVTVLTVLSPLVYGQAIFAHNDYVKPQPFSKAFELKVAFIEADIFLENGSLVVTHEKKEIDPSKTLKSMYLEPLSQKSKAGKMYNVTLMIDIKSDARSTMAALTKELEPYRNLDVNYVVSGNYPPPSEWSSYPDLIWFDGRPNVQYTKEQQDRLKLVSTSFSSVSTWNGNGEIPANDLGRIKQTIEIAHNLGKPMRFWASPDFENAWQKFIDAGVDILNSDHIEELSTFLEKN